VPRRDRIFTRIIDDDTPERDLFPKGYKGGLDLSLRGPGYAYGGLAVPYPAELRIPRSEWEPRIKERKARGAMFRQFLLSQGITVLDQNGTNYCWANGPVYAAMAKRAAQGLPHVRLSPASVAAPIVNYKNEGGWGRDALAKIIRDGIVPQSLWGPNAIDRRLDTPEARKAALPYRCFEWWELEPRNLDDLASCLLLDMNPVAVGFSWWSHEVCAVDMDWLDGEPVLIVANNYGEKYGTKGYEAIRGRRMLADDACCPRAMRAA
jgi:hypothetical protein